VGGLTGFNNGIITDAYWDVNATGQSVSAGNALGLTTAEMQGAAARENMPGLDFQVTWQTQPDDYPRLQSLPRSPDRTPFPDGIPGVSDDPPTDPDGDGIYEDVNGDGDFDIFDVQAFLETFSSSSIQNNSELFDVTGDGRVTIFDVQALLDQL
jgi:hypothetical protein